MGTKNIHVPTVNDIFAIYSSLYSLSVHLLSTLRPSRSSEKIAEGQMKALAASLRYQLRQIFPRTSPVARRMFTRSTPPTLGLALPLSSTSSPQTHTDKHKQRVSADHLHTLSVQLPLTSLSCPRFA